MNKEKINSELEELLEADGFELVDVKFLRQNNKTCVQVFIDKIGDENINLDECGVWGNKIGAYFDVNEDIGESYILEVSSPGIDRLIKKEKDFIRFAGQKIKIKLKNPHDGTRIYNGVLRGFEDGCVLLSDDIKFKIDDIAEVRLAPNDAIS